MKIDLKTRRLIYKLKEENGMNFVEIRSYLEKQGIYVSYETVISNYRIVDQMRNGKREKKNLKNLSNDEIFKFKELGLNYQTMKDIFATKGIFVSVSTLKDRCTRIYNEKGISVPKSKINSRVIYKIFELNNNNKNHLEILESLRKEGIEIPEENMKYICEEVLTEDFIKKLVAKKDSKQPNGNRIDIPIEKIIELKEKGFSYARIAEYFKRQGFPVAQNTIRNRFIEIYGADRKNEPKTIKAVAKTKKRKGNSILELLPEDRIYELRSKKFSYERIAQILSDEGIKANIDSVAKKVKMIYEERNEKNPDLRNRPNMSDDIIYELREVGLTYKEIVDFYRMIGETVSLSGVEKRCIRLYKRRGEVVPKVKYVYNRKNEKNVTRFRREYRRFRKKYATTFR